MRNELIIRDFLNEHSVINEPIYSIELHEVFNQYKLDKYLHDIKLSFNKYNIATPLKKKCYGMRHALKAEHFDLIYHKLDIGPDLIELNFGNYIEEKDIPNLEKHISLIEKEGYDKIKELMYSKASDGKPLSDKGGAGVGIFDMAIKSKGNIKQKIFEINSKFYYFTHIKIK
jgi:hypothetical protein